MAQVAAEIGISASGLSLNDSRVRQLAGRPSGAISFADLRGKSWLLPPTITFKGCTNYVAYDTAEPRYYYDVGEYIEINYSLGGGPGTLSIARIYADDTWGDMENISLGSTRARFKQRTQANKIARLTVRVTISNASGSDYIDVKLSISDY